ncbi:MAG: hypothetical protein ACYTER_03925 [Planctomycetota bacterium]|jgi:hypothetical protein
MEFLFQHILPWFELVIIVIPFVFVLFSGNVSKGAFLAWFLFVVWTAVLFMLNSLSVSVDIELKDGADLLIAILLGWLPGTMISALGFFCRQFILKHKPSWLKVEDTNHD